MVGGVVGRLNGISVHLILILLGVFSVMWCSFVQ